MAYINGKQVLFSPKVNLEGYESGYNQMMEEWYNAYFCPQDWRNQVYYLAEMFAYRNVDNFKFTKPFPITKNPTGVRLDCKRMFACYRGEKLIPPEILNLDGATFTGETALMQTFYYVRYVEECPCYNWNAPPSYDNTFYEALFVTIGTLKSEEHTKYIRTFNGCTSLENITFDGTIGQNISFADSPLSVESGKNIILHLKDYSTDTTNAGKILTLSDTSKTAMANLGTIEEFNNKTYDEYITDIGWVLG